MRVPHPLWRGFWLAAAMAAGLVLLGFSDALGPYRLDRRLVAYAGAIVVGAFIGALPGRLKAHTPFPKRGRRSWQRCLRAFLCGIGMALGIGIAGDGRIIPALLTGSVGAYAFCAMALLTGFVTVRIAERRRA